MTRSEKLDTLALPYAPPASNAPTPPTAEPSPCASETTDPPDNNDMEISPKKIAKLTSNNNASLHLPSLCTNCGLESPPHKNVATPTFPPGLNGKPTTNRPPFNRIPKPQPISGQERVCSTLTSRAVSPTLGPNSCTQSIHFRTPLQPLDSGDKDNASLDEDKIMGDIESTLSPKDNDSSSHAGDTSNGKHDERHDPTPPPPPPLSSSGTPSHTPPRRLSYAAPPASRTLTHTART
ncbi:hypothetical protein FB451DRAFT_1195800 [Mycena latifolia]|nr:hypothetical protein FB451DRAFT_1195800 [Mycena latifolia]